ncbi:MAG: EamA family transporter [Ignavibacteriales bacterium]
MIQTDWFLLAIFASIIASIVGVLQKAAINKTIDPVAFGIYFQSLVGIIGIPMAIINGDTLSLNIGTIQLLILMAFLCACANLLYYFALKSTEISQASILTSTSALWLLFGGLIFFGENLTIYKTSGVLLVVFGVFVIYYNKSSLKGFGIAQVFLLLSAVLSGFTGILDKHLIESLPVSTYQVLSYLLQAVITAVLVPDSIKTIGSFFKSKKTNLIIICSAVLLNIGTYCYFSSLKIGGEISKINPILQASTILTIILGLIFFNEKQNLLKKIIGASIILIGVIFIKAI